MGVVAPGEKKSTLSTPFTGLHLSSVLKPSLSVPAITDRAVLELQARRLQGHFLRPVDGSVAQCLMIRLHNEDCISLRPLFIKIAPNTVTSGNALTLRLPD